MDKDKILKYAGREVGETVLVERIPDKKLGYGKIHSIHIKDNFEDSAFTFTCEMCGSFRMGMFKDIIDSPSKSQMKKVNTARSKLWMPGTRRKKK